MNTKALFKIIFLLSSLISTASLAESSDEKYYTPYQGSETSILRQSVFWESSVEELFPGFLNSRPTRKAKNIEAFKKLQINWAQVDSLDIEYGDYYINWHVSVAPKDISQVVFGPSNNPKMVSMSATFTRNTHAPKQAVKILLKNKSGEVIAELNGHENPVQTTDPLFQITSVFIPESETTIEVDSINNAGENPSTFSSRLIEGLFLAYNGYNEFELFYSYFPHSALFETFLSPSGKVEELSLLKGERLPLRGAASLHDFSEKRTWSDAPIENLTDYQSGYDFSKDSPSCSNILND